MRNHVIPRWCRRSAMPIVLAVLALNGTRGLWAQEANVRQLTFAQRVEAQRAIERVYYIHRSGGARGFEEAVPDSLLVRKVRAYLAESVALEEFWNTPVTDVMLRREVERMIGNSRLPARLGEIRTALGHDDRLLAETLARESLVDRLCRSFLAADTRVESRDWDTWWAEASPRFDPLLARTVVNEFKAATSLPSGAASCALQDLWASGRAQVVPQYRYAHTAVWTGSEVILWGGNLGGPAGAFLNTGDRYDPATDTWTATTTIGAPSARSEHTAVWTGSGMIVWGGWTGGDSTNTGGRYDPVADAWTPTSTSNAPPPTRGHSAVWTGTLMVVWGGDFGDTAGGRYDPSSDTWSPTSLIGVPSGRVGQTAVWTGAEMIIWGGTGDRTGARYNPMSDQWTATSTINAPSPRQAHTAVWTGSQMIVWGGFGAGYTPTGGRYDPVSDMWTPTAIAGAPVMRYDHAAVWTGTEMVVWGGTQYGPYPDNQPVNTGGRYDAATDSWQATSVVNAPFSSGHATAVWTGDLMIVQGGRYSPAGDAWTPTSSARKVPLPAHQPASVWTGAELIVWSGPGQNGGGRYDPATDAWTPTGTSGAPSGRTDATAVWTGSEMLIWGGESGGTPLGTGGRYSPLTDTWAPMTGVDAPTARAGHTAVWSGSEMIVWGGDGLSGLLADGGRYDPVADHWTPMLPAGAPDPRANHTAIWTGSLMVIWGGTFDMGITTGTGGRFDPRGNGGAGAWTSTAGSGAPGSRNGHTAVWTGEQMIVWGGAGYDGRSSIIYNNGGRYDPIADQWAPMTTVGAPGDRIAHTAVWSGDRMIVWGGYTYSSQFMEQVALNTGALYDAASDAWTPMTISGAPEPRYAHVAAWTGQAMLVWGGSTFAGDTMLTIDDRSMPWYGNPVPGPPADLDGDGVSACRDCDDDNPGAWGVPGEATDLFFNDDDVTLVWSPPFFGGAATVGYDLLRSDTASDFQSAGVCVASGIPEPTAVDAETPALGRFFFYLARARNACPGGTGTVGADSSGAPRAALICP